MTDLYKEHIGLGTILFDDDGNHLVSETLFDVCFAASGCVVPVHCIIKNKTQAASFTIHKPGCWYLIHITVGTMNVGVLIVVANELGASSSCTDCCGRMDCRSRILIVPVH